MKKRHYSRCSFVLLLLTFLFLANLGGMRTVKAASKIKLSRSVMTVFETDTQTLKVIGTSKKVVWTSSNTKVATVSSKGEVKALKTGKTTITAKVDGQKLTCEVTVYGVIGTYYLAWNVNWDPSPKNRKLTASEAAEVRYAINLLIDRTQIAKIVGVGFPPATSYVAEGIMEPDGSQFYKHAGPKNAGYYSTKAQTAAAMRILKKYYSVSGGKVTNFPNFTYIYNIYNGAAHEKIARNIKSKMKAVGIEMSIKGYELEKYMDILDKGNYDLIRYGWAAEANDPLDFLKVFAAGTNENTCKLGTGKHASASIYTVDLKGIGKYKNLKGTWKQTYQQLISYIKEEKNAEIRNKLLHKAEDLLMETACVCPLYYFI